MNRLKNFLGHHPVRPTMNYTIIVSLVVILLSAWPVWGATYYVKAGGNDNLDGLSDATAWATISKVKAKVVSGDTVYFRSQDTWTSATPPVLTATAGVTYDGSTYGSGTRAKLQATGGQPGNVIDGVVKIYVSNVTFQGFEIDGNGQSIGGIYIGYLATSDVTNVTIDNCKVHNGKTSAESPPEYYYGIFVSQRYSHTTSNVTIKNTEVYEQPHEGIAIYPAWAVSGNKVDTVLIRNCLIHHTGQEGHRGNAIDVANDSDNVTIEFNTVYSAPVGFAMAHYDPATYGSPDGLIFRYNLLYNNTYGISVASYGYGIGGDASIYGNILVDSGITLTGDNYNSVSIRFYNNTIYNPTIVMYGLYVNSGSSNTSGIEFKNNIIVTGSQIWPIKDLDGVLVTHSNNLLKSGRSEIVSTTSHTYTLSDIETWEPTVKKTDPAFIAGTLPTGFTGTYGTNMVPNTNYFSITSGDALNNGATLGSPYNGCINGAGLATPITRPQGAAYDIGAYEYVGSVLDGIKPQPPTNLRVK